MFKAGDTHLLKADAFYTPKASNIQQDSAKIVRNVHMQIEEDPQPHRKQFLKFRVTKSTNFTPNACKAGYI